MIKVREQNESDTGIVKSIIAAATDELRSTYRPIEIKAKNEIHTPTRIVATINEDVVGSAEYLIYVNSILVRGIAVSPFHRRQGIAKSIIEYVALKAKKEGKTQLELSTVKETGNTNVFLHIGFTIDSEKISKTYEGANGEQVTIVKLSKKWHNNLLNQTGAKNASPS